MADGKEKESKGGGGNKKFLLIVIVAVVIGAGLAGGATWFFLSHQTPPKAQKAKPEHGAEEEAAEEESHEAATPVFQPLEPIVVNLSGGSESVMRVAISVQLKAEKDKEKLTAFMPRIQGDLMLLFSRQTAEELLTADGKLKLILETKDTINKALGVKSPKDEVVKQVSFTEMIIQ